MRHKCFVLRLMAWELASLAPTPNPSRLREGDMLVLAYLSFGHAGGS